MVLVAVGENRYFEPGRAGPPQRREGIVEQGPAGLAASEIASEKNIGVVVADIGG